MSVFSAPDFDAHEQVLFCTDAGAGLTAIIAIHNTRLGPAVGGTRMWPYETEAAALTDVLRLSRGMTYKSAMAGLPYGGGKIVVLGDSRTDKTPALFQALGRHIERLGGGFYTGEDVGTSPEDMDEIARETACVFGCATGGSGDPSPATAYGVYLGLKAAVERRLGRRDLEGLRVAIQGLGHVGFNLGKRLAADGAVLVGCDIDPAALARARDEFGLVAVDPADIFDQEVDVFAPCALGGAINDDTVNRLRATVVAGAANNQLAEARHGAALAARGILYAPDYVINAGGLINITFEKPAYDRDVAFAAIETLYDTTIEVFDYAERNGIPTHEAADRIAQARFRA